MATAMSSILDELVCGVCLEDRELLLLPICQHRYCKVCLDKLSKHGKKSFHCPECTRLTIIPQQGFKPCRLSSYIKEKLLSAQLDAAQNRPYRTEQYHSSESASESKPCSLREMVRYLNDYVPYRDRMLSLLPNKLTRVVADPCNNIPPFPRVQGRSVTCNFCLPLIERQVVFDKRTGQLSDYHLQYAESINKNLHSMFMAESKPRQPTKWVLKKSTTYTALAPYSVLEIFKTSTPPKHKTSCYVVFCRHIHTGHNFVIVLESDWGMIHEWEIDCESIAVGNDRVYGLKRGTAARDTVKVHSLDGHCLKPIQHVGFANITHLKVSEGYKRQIVFVTDSVANMIFAFIDDIYCWEWTPSPDNSLLVGPVATSSDTSLVYVAVRTKENRECHITMLDLEGKEMTKLTYEYGEAPHFNVARLEAQSRVGNNLVDDVFAHPSDGNGDDVNMAMTMRRNGLTWIKYKVEVECFSRLFCFIYSQYYLWQSLSKMDQRFRIVLLLMFATIVLVFGIRIGETWGIFAVLIERVLVVLFIVVIVVLPACFFIEDFVHMMYSRR